VSAAELPVQKQHEAYNACDIEAFIQWWAEDCPCCEVPDRLFANGAAEIRERHIARMAVGNLAVDHETVTRTFPEVPVTVDVIAIYQVERITRGYVAEYRADG
jgi:hypothetical protein